MGKVYSAPIPAPKMDYDNWARDERKYMTKLREWARMNSKDPNAGDVIKFSVADGYAVYVVLSLKPVKLIHVNLGDGYSFQYVDRLTAKDLKARIAAEKALTRLFDTKTESLAERMKRKEKA